MLKTRVIPCLLIKDRGLVKTVKFKNPKYVGDPINAVRILNDKEVDELIFLDITATVENRKPQFELIEDIASECFMPFSYGGGIRSIEDAKMILKLGAEKIVVNTHALENPSFIVEAAERFGSQSVVVSFDVLKGLLGRYSIFSRSGTKNTNIDPIDFAKKVAELGAGELFVNSIDRDGVMKGYDIKIVRSVAEKVDIPVIACGGAGRLEDFREAVEEGKASAVAAGSMFVFHGPHRAVLINYPSQEDLKKTFQQA
ncbi:MAG: imidazole glycerol phosphate synthase subunit HisF [Candidatus Altiarchaeales archaeon WOR_SM1_79]|nr:MAG: imidazole glycerol phosphate synthase subunit HisF [Candidatus Altiarchaeales archaeon WOR_SM1_79]